MNELQLLSAEYCARQNATPLLELWALLLVLCAGAALTFNTGRRAEADRKSPARFCAGAMLFFAFLTVLLAASSFYGCTATAASEQGLGSNLAAGTYTLLRCLGTDVFATVQGWALFVISSMAGIALAILGIVRRGAAVRVPAFGGAALLAIAALAFAFFLLFGFSWCTSQRLM